MERKHIDLYTSRGETLSGPPWQSYPRPQLRRESFFNLNGKWEFARSDSEEFPLSYDKTILVPFPAESLLSGVTETFSDGEYLFYRRSFVLPEGFLKDRVLLHFGAADQIAQVYLNGFRLGSHIGGYLPFSFDITEHLRDENLLEIRITDQLGSYVLPYGKQCRDPKGMWYTPVTGLWQTVWLESVPRHYIRELSLQTGENWAEIDVKDNSFTGLVTVVTPDGPLEIPLKNGVARVELSTPRMWSPKDPWLYEFTLETETDRISSYFALRTLSVETVNGLPRLCLNGKPYFFHGLLDQGYWSDGLFTPACPECYADDIRAMKALGFNTLRKHIKVEPEQFYYDCDRLGMIVFQDMVNNGRYSFLRDTALPTVGLKGRSDRNLHRDPETRRQFLLAMEETVAHLKNHPCICYWTIFNEGWGQFESDSAYRRLKELDSTRFIDSTSGWFTGKESDVISAHVYFRPFRAKAGHRPLVLSEFGGYTLALPGHVYCPEKSYGYRTFTDGEKLEAAVAVLYEQQVLPAVAQGLCASIYTQVSDVEEEINGILSYDRRVCKLSPEVMLPLAEKLSQAIAEQ